MSFDLISHVQSDEGFFAILGIKGDKKKQKLVATREEFDNEVERLKAAEYNVYFGVSKFATDRNRQKDNVLNTKCFWVDLDCGEKKDYLSKLDALKDLGKFCETVALPKPTVVDSGNGIHAYWAQDVPLTRLEWEPIAAKFKALCIEKGLRVDPNVFEVSRVLRVPETKNYKDSFEKEAKVLRTAPVMKLSNFKNTIGFKEETVRVPKLEQSALQKQLMQNFEFSFDKIMRRSAKGEGCQQILNQFLHQDEVSEPMWFDMLSIAQRCTDRDVAIHKMSRQHRDYDFNRTEQKADNTTAPHTCVTFESSNPGGCDGCIWKGKIKTPIVIGKVVPEFVNNTSTSQKEEEVIPSYPAPYFRGQHGGVYMKLDEENIACVYEHDLYVVNRMFDPNPEVGEILILRHRLPHDGLKEFNVKLSTVHNKESLKEALARQGVSALPKRFDAILNYIIRANQELQNTRRAELMRTQFGWADKDTKFIIGSSEISAHEINYSPPSGTTKEMATQMGPKGSFEKWKEIANLYNRPGLEPNAFAMLTAFGAPLLKFTGHSGALINLIHKTSGSGKSTVLAMMNSVYGHPVGLMSIWKDTLAARMMKLGIMKNLPLGIDEVTNMVPQDSSTMVYCISQGKGYDRMKASANELRVNSTTWQTICLSSSNASLYDKLAAFKASPDGETMRLIEYEIEPTRLIDPALAKKMFDIELKHNYGHAGQRYVQYLLGNLENVVKGVILTQEMIDRDLGFTNRERFWSAVAACNMAGGYIAKDLGLIDWDLHRIYAWMTDMLQVVREDTKAPTHSELSIIGEYLNENVNNMLVINDICDKRSSMSDLPIMTPRGALNIRYEPDTKQLYLASKPFRKYCVDNQVSVNDLAKTLRKYDEYKGQSLKRMGKGTGSAAMLVNVWQIDCREDGPFGGVATQMKKVGVSEDD